MNRLKCKNYAIKFLVTEIEGHQNNVKIIRNINESNFITGGVDTNININDKN